MATKDELHHLRQINSQLISLLEARGINWLAELDAVADSETITTPADAIPITSTPLTTTTTLTLPPHKRLPSSEPYAVAAPMCIQSVGTTSADAASSEP